MVAAKPAGRGLRHAGGAGACLREQVSHVAAHQTHSFGFASSQRASSSPTEGPLRWGQSGRGTSAVLRRLQCFRASVTHAKCRGNGAWVVGGPAQPARLTIARCPPPQAASCTYIGSETARKLVAGRCASLRARLLPPPPLPPPPAPLARRHQGGSARASPPSLHPALQAAATPWQDRTPTSRRQSTGWRST